MKKQTAQTTRELVDVKDIRNGLLYTNSGYMFGYLRIYPTNLNLKTPSEMRALTERLCAHVKGEYVQQAYLSLPREVDIERQKKYLERIYREEMSNLQRKRILKIMLDHAIELSSSHENFEHQHFLKFWKKREGRDGYLEERELKKKMADWEQYYREIGIKSHILEDSEILMICNLFANGIQATHTPIKNLRYEPHTLLRDRR